MKQDADVKENQIVCEKIAKARLWYSLNQFTLFFATFLLIPILQSQRSEAQRSGGGHQMARAEVSRLGDTTHIEFLGLPSFTI